MTLLLPTLDSRPSWVNRAGHVDRSACVEIRAAEIWPWTEMIAGRTATKRGSRRPAARVQREAAGQFTVTFDLLRHFHDRRPPRILVGDYRTGKSNAMIYILDSGRRLMGEHRPLPLPHPGAGAHPGAGVGGKTKESYFPPDTGPDADLSPNPNRGASRRKIFGLPATWRQEVRVERWRLHAQLAQHFLICPRCRQKKLKLFLPLCHAQESRDAATAALWLKTHFRTQPYDETALKVIARYSALFGPRGLFCGACLGLRYGEVRASAWAKKPLPEGWTPAEGTAARLRPLADQEEARGLLRKLARKGRRVAKIKALGEKWGW